MGNTAQLITAKCDHCTRDYRTFIVGRNMCGFCLSNGHDHDNCAKCIYTEPEKPAVDLCAHCGKYHETQVTEFGEMKFYTCPNVSTLNPVFIRPWSEAEIIELQIALAEFQREQQAKLLVRRVFCLHHPIGITCKECQ